MSPAPRHTEEIAPEAIHGLLNRIAALAAPGATTAEIEEGSALLPELSRTLRVWITARHLIAAAPRRRAIPVETPEEAEELDRIEHAHPTPGGLHPIFESLTSPMRRGA